MKKLEKKLRKSIGLDEKHRLENLKRYKILYAKTESVFDQLAAFTATMLNAPIAIINFVDRESVWVKADESSQPTAGLFEEESNLCSLAIINESAFAFEGFAERPQLMSNALIAGEAGLQFYAAAAITTDEGFNVGSVCIVDKKRREFLPHEQEQLEWVASMVRREMNKKIAGKICV
ncbi:hypothetical protein D3C87_1216160 [compost metagenome]